jgi:pimeloyl-ACP methyl ester carboxylesterase
MIKFLKSIAIVCVTLLTLVLLALAGFRAAAAMRETQDAVALLPANGQLVQTSFGEIHVSHWGPKTGKPVLMTHGMGAWGGLWVATAEALAAKGYHVIALDQAPFGFSARETTDFSRSAQADRIKEVLDGLGIDSAFLVGHSYGGGVTLEAALRYPERVTGLVLVCPVTGLADNRPLSAEANVIPLPLRSEFLADFLVTATVTNPLLTKTLMKQFMYKKDKITQAHVAILQKPMTRSGNTRAMTLWLQQFLSSDTNALSAQRDSVAKITVPAELIWGNKDTVTPISQGEDLAQLIPFGTFQKLNNIGHMPQIEGPEVFNHALINALQRLDGGLHANWRLRPTLAVLYSTN